MESEKEVDDADGDEDKALLLVIVIALGEEQCPKAFVMTLGDEHWTGQHDSQPAE